MSIETRSIDACVGSILFTDLVGFTEFNDAVGDSDALRVLEQQTEMAMSVTSRSPGARIVKELGDGLMIWFETAGEGLRGAVEMLNAVDAARALDEFPLAVRMGLHHGDALPRGDDLVGRTVNIAARISSLAGPGELLVSEDVLLSCDHDDCEPLQPVGPVLVKGLQDPIWLHRLSTR